MIPTTTEITIPIANGWSFVASLMNVPSQFIAMAIGGQIRYPERKPKPKVTIGVTRISTFVSLETILPNSTAMMTATKTPKGPAA